MKEISTTYKLVGVDMRNLTATIRSYTKYREHGDYDVREMEYRMFADAYGNYYVKLPYGVKMNVATFA